MKITTIIFAFLLCYNVIGQKYVDQIQVGEIMPTELNIGGYTERESGECTCRIFSIEYKYDLTDPWVVQSLKNQKNAKLGTMISIFYNSKNVVVGILKMEMNTDENSTKEFFQNYYNYDMKLVQRFEEYEFIEKEFKTEPKYFSIKIKNYGESKSEVIRNKSVVNKIQIEEVYLIGSEYESKYTSSSTSTKTTVAESSEIAEAFGDLDKDGIDEKVVILDTGIEIKAGTKRKILIYKKSANDWKIWHTSEGAVISGGYSLASFEKLSIERGCIVLRHFGGSRNKWFYTHRFRYQNNDWELIGATIENYTMCELSEKFDYNFSTGKMIYEKEIESCKDDEDSKIISKSTAEFRKKLNVLPKMDGFKVGENVIIFPNSERQFYY